jgi:hypothetical protein
MPVHFGFIFLNKKFLKIFFAESDTNLFKDIGCGEKVKRKNFLGG